RRAAAGPDAARRPPPRGPSGRAEGDRARAGGAIMRRVALLVLLAGCAGVHPYHPNFYSIDGDIRLGQQLQKEVDGDVTQLRLSALTQMVNGIGSRPPAAGGAGTALPPLPPTLLLAAPPPAHTLA